LHASTDAVPAPHRAHPCFLPAQAKACSGAAALLALLDLSGQRVYCANVGAALCLLSRIAGSFNATRPEGFFLSAEHTTRWVGVFLGGRRGWCV
jgi:hypothetical protein